jgi:cupin fold WbuC family metalloprotein
MKIFDHKVLDALSRQAAESPRRRKNLNLHDDYDEPCQRLFNAVEPGSYVRPHRHSDPHKPECIMVVRGRMALVVFDDLGAIEEVVPLGDGCDVLAIELPPDLWHMLVALEPGSVFFETKAGPYLPSSDKIFAPWAPEEGSAAVQKYLDDIMTKVAKACP